MGFSAPKAESHHAWGLGQSSGEPSVAPMSHNLTDQSPAVLVEREIAKGRFGYAAL
jgi:hypothetical protein